MSEKHPIEALMTTAMESIREMVDVNTVVGEAVEAKDGTVIIPVSKVACGFGAGGGEFSNATGEEGSKDAKDLPFGGGSGGGVSVRPVGFLVVSPGDIRFLSVDGNAVAERLIDKVPMVIDKIQSAFAQSTENKDKKASPTVDGEFAGS
ncbi:sporulation protein YtfJ [Desulfonispora thiosulfatigenes DSM 11270]|uniref:Sporulation protein YtfJ n=1 Tax=Desulfonispora thiosulfatigenes DSM 11270 TaxID=656914 RepID=A0A1W1VMT7_DESTI|nr:GerW family sporulation protein [Desulfonispora thiosulfatigenes]SMB94361.1 sporulation protein YtfJ [Desulfonispora thiosulfatigenes DSM 11270]